MWSEIGVFLGILFTLFGGILVGIGGTNNSISGTVSAVFGALIILAIVQDYKNQED